jgi:hypothetical protein
MAKEADLIEILHVDLTEAEVGLDVDVWIDERLRDLLGQVKTELLSEDVGTLVRRVFIKIRPGDDLTHRVLVTFAGRDGGLVVEADPSNPRLSDAVAEAVNRAMGGGDAVALFFGAQ